MKLLKFLGFLKNCNLKKVLTVASLWILLSFQFSGFAEKWGNILILNCYHVFSDRARILNTDCNGRLKIWSKSRLKFAVANVETRQYSCNRLCQPGNCYRCNRCKTEVIQLQSLVKQKNKTVWYVSKTVTKAILNLPKAKLMFTI